MRTLIRCIDGLIRRTNSIFEFCDAEDCLLRLQATTAPHDITLSDGTVVRAGDPVLKLHVWNEHVPPMGPEGSDLAWAAKVRRLLLRSMVAAARWVAGEPRVAGARAIGGATVLIAPGLEDEGRRGALRLMQRLGFDVLPCQGPLGRFGEFWENVYTWVLMWAFNKASLRHRRLLRIQRTEVWMSMPEFLRRYNR